MSASDMPSDVSPGTSDPLVRGQWLWRRLYVFAASLGLWALLDRVIASGPPAILPRIGDGLLALMALTLVLYLVAPTAQQLVELLASLKLRLETGGRT
ncbi:MAG: hypothetical protein ACOH2M_19375 [Cypionkella sp.]